MSVACYLVGDTLVDSGTSHARDELRTALRAYPIRQIYVTHHHEDHSGNAGAIAAERGIPVLAPARAKELLERGFFKPPMQLRMWGDFAPYPVAPLDIGRDRGGLPVVLETSLGPLHLHPAEGHAWDMTVAHLPSHGVLFSADLFVATRIKFFRRDEMMEPMIASLERLAALDFDALACAHRPQWSDGPALLCKKRDWLIETRDRCRDLHARGVPPHRIRDTVLGGEEWRTWLWTLGDICTLNIVRAALGAHRTRRDVGRSIQRYRDSLTSQPARISA